MREYEGPLTIVLLATVIVVANRNWPLVSAASSAFLGKFFAFLGCLFWRNAKRRVKKIEDLLEHLDSEFSTSIPDIFEVNETLFNRLSEFIDAFESKDHCAQSIAIERFTSFVAGFFDDTPWTRSRLADAILNMIASWDQKCGKEAADLLENTIRRSAEMNFVQEDYW